MSMCRQARQNIPWSSFFILHQAISGKGIDRHLLGLKLTAIEHNIDIPESQNVFLDPAYSVSGTWRLSTSQVIFCCRLTV